MSARLLAFLVVAVAGVAIAAGCGSDSDDGSSPAQAGNSSETQSGAGSDGESDTLADDSAENGSDEGSGGETSAEKDEFVKQASAACLKEREAALPKIAVYEKAHRSDGLPQEVLAERSVKVAMLSAISGEIAAIRQLGPPAGDEEELEAILVAVEADLNKAKTKSSAPAIEGSFTKSDELLKAYGLDGCAKNTE